jgi:MFS family permease
MGTWYLANGFGIALGGLLGFGIGNIKGSLPSWKFEFLIIGALCFVWGIVMYIFLPDSPVTAKGLTLREKRVVVERLRGNQTGIENKHLKAYQVKEAFCDVKLYLFFLLGMVCNIPNGGMSIRFTFSHLTHTLLPLPSQTKRHHPQTREKLTPTLPTGISNFGTIIIKGFGFSTLVTTLMQIPYGAIIALSILICVFANEYVEKTGRQARSWFILLFLAPNVAGAFGLAYLETDNQAGRLVSYYLTGPYNAAFVMVLSMSTANTAGHTKKVVTNGMFMSFGYPTYPPTLQIL